METVTVSSGSPRGSKSSQGTKQSAVSWSSSVEKTSPSAFCPLTLNSPRTLKSNAQSSPARM
ncbi:MAG: hypothetical protein ACLUI3_11375 [Christensenellales bacterium]